MKTTADFLSCKIPKGFLIASLVIFVLLGAFLWFFSKGDSFILLRGELNPVKNFIFKYITWLGDGITAVALALFFLFRKKWKAAAQIFGSYLLSGIVAQSFKKTMHMPRPARFFEIYHQQIEAVDGVQLYMSFTSFPSGHSATAFALAISLILISPWWRKQWWQAFVLAWIIGYSRIYLGQHFPMDVYWGALLGILSGLAVCPWLNQWKRLNRLTVN